jgi:hypothetical protein
LKNSKEIHEINWPAEALDSSRNVLIQASTLSKRKLSKATAPVFICYASKIVAGLPSITDHHWTLRGRLYEMAWNKAVTNNEKSQKYQ